MAHLQMGYLLKMVIFHGYVKIPDGIYIYGSNIWLVVSNMAFVFHHIWVVIPPIDFHIFQRGRSTTNQI